VCLFQLIGSTKKEFFDIVSKKIKWEIRNYPDTCLVAYQNSQLVGFSFTEYSDSDAFIDYLAVDPDFRRTGVGRAMVTKTLQRLKQRKIRFVGLMTGVANKAALAFWKSQGFEEIRFKALVRMLE
jgi:ribosomal protein S18 acetylase RimI-like enzyme